MKYRQAISREESLLKETLAHFGKVADIVKGESFERWAKDVLPGKFTSWMAIHIGSEISSPQGIMFSGNVSDEIWPAFYKELSRVHLGEVTRDLFEGPPPEVFERDNMDGLVLAVVFLPMLSADEDVTKMQVLALENLLLLIDACEEDLLQVWESVDEAEGLITAVKGVRSLRKLYHKAQEPDPEPVEVKPMEPHGCSMCKKDGIATDDDGKWYCKKHAYPLGLLDRPEVEEDEEVEEEEMSYEEASEFTFGADTMPDVDIEKLPASLRRRMGR
jgi:hypothetical protein